MKFVAADYWDIVATYEPGGFTARLTAVDGRRVAQGRDFAQDGTPRKATAVSWPSRGSRARRRPGGCHVPGPTFVGGRRPPLEGFLTLRKVRGTRPPFEVGSYLLEVFITRKE